MEPIRVLVVDDHPVVRRGLESLLAQYEEFQVVGSTDGREGLVPLVQELHPDVVLLDIRLGELNGLELARQLNRSGHPCRVIILSSYDDEAYLAQAAKAGVWGYLLKSASPEVLADAIRSVYRGQKCLFPSLGGKALDQLATMSRKWAQAKSGLTEQELRLLELMADGASVQEIAAALFLSERSVKRRTQAVIEKLGAANRTQAVAEAFRRGIL